MIYFCDAKFILILVLYHCNQIEKLEGINVQPDFQYFINDEMDIRKNSL